MVLYTTSRAARSVLETEQFSCNQEVFFFWRANDDTTIQTVRQHENKKQDLWTPFLPESGNAKNKVVIIVFFCQSQTLSIIDEELFLKIRTHGDASNIVGKAAFHIIDYCESERLRCLPIFISFGSSFRISRNRSKDLSNGTQRCQSLRIRSFFPYSIEIRRHLR